MWWPKPTSACGKETQFPFGLIGRSIKCSYKQVGFQTIIIMKYRCRTRCTCTYMYLKAPIIRVQIKNITFADREYRFSFASVDLDDGRACATVEFQLSFIPVRYHYLVKPNCSSNFAPYNIVYLKQLNHINSPQIKPTRR